MTFMRTLALLLPLLLLQARWWESVADANFFVRSDLLARVHGQLAEGLIVLVCRIAIA